MDLEKIRNDFTLFLPNKHIKIKEPLRKYTYTKTGGVADIAVFPSTYEEIQKVWKYAKKHQIPITILGNGSNVIVKDGGIRGVVIMMGRLNNITIADKMIKAQSGAVIIDVSKEALRHSLTGLEFACGIPGTVGGAVYMNAGAYGGEIKEIIKEVLVLNENGDVMKLSPNELKLGYRKSVLMEKEWVVLEATFSLELGVKEEIKRKMDELTRLRESKQPLEYPSCGSVFKRPKGYYAGKLIQDSGVQGYRIGGIEVSKKHAGFMVNVDNGTSSDYQKLIHHVKRRVREAFGVDLEPEVRLIGEDSFFDQQKNVPL